MNKTSNATPWAQVIHIYQPPRWSPTVIRRVMTEAYDPLVTNLEQHPDIRLTLNICASLTEQLLELGYESLVHRLRALVERGQVELLASAAFHPILPLLPDAEIRRQIELQHTFHQEVFGAAYHPEGFFPPELAVSDRLFGILREYGYRYVIADDIAWSGTLTSPVHTTRFVSAQSQMTTVFRSRHLSDTFLDAYVKDEHTFHDVVGRGHSTPIVTAVDGENLGHHRPGMDRVWLEILTSGHFQPVTVSELLEQSRGIVTFPLHASSWSSLPDELAHGIPYALWNHPQNSLHALLWNLTHLALEVGAHAGSEVRDELDRALNSDHFWWASASPWWSLELVEQGSHRLHHVITQTNNATAIAQSQSLVDKLHQTLLQWQRTGIADQRKRASLESVQRARFFGGEQLT